MDTRDITCLHSLRLPIQQQLSITLFSFNLSAACASCRTFVPSRTPAAVVKSIDFFPVWLPKEDTSSSHQCSIQSHRTRNPTWIFSMLSYHPPTAAWISPLSMAGVFWVFPQHLPVELRIFHRRRQLLLQPFLVIAFAIHAPSFSFSDRLCLVILASYHSFNVPCLVPFFRKAIFFLILFLLHTECLFVLLYFDRYIRPYRQYISSLVTRRIKKSRSYLSCLCIYMPHF